MFNLLSRLPLSLQGHHAKFPLFISTSMFKWIKFIKQSYSVADRQHLSPRATTSSLQNMPIFPIPEYRKSSPLFWPLLCSTKTLMFNKINLWSVHTDTSKCQKWAKASNISFFITEFLMFPLLQTYCTHILSHLRRWSFLPYSCSLQKSLFPSRTLQVSPSANPITLPSIYIQTPATAHPPHHDPFHCYHTRQGLHLSTLAPLHTNSTNWRIILIKYVKSCHPLTQIPHVSPHFIKLKSQILTVADSLPQYLSDLLPPSCYSSLPPEWRLLFL